MRGHLIVAAPGPLVIAGAEARLAVTSLGLDLPMAEIYAGVL